jgi:hypothetical protein
MWTEIFIFIYDLIQSNVSISKALWSVLTVFKVLWATDNSQKGHNCGSLHAVWQGCCKWKPPTKVPLKHVPGQVTVQSPPPHTHILKIYNHEAASPGLAYRPGGRGGPHFWLKVCNVSHTCARERACAHTHTQNSLPETWDQNQKSVNSIIFSFQTGLNYWWCEKTDISDGQMATAGREKKARQFSLNHLELELSVLCTV